MIVRYGKDSGVGRHPGSMAKVVTILVVLDTVPPEDWSTTITIDATDMAGSQESVMGLQVGDIISIEDLLYGLMLPSGNDAARALARHAGQIIRGESGTWQQYRAEFVAAMNEKAGSLAMSASTFVDSWGVTAGTRMSPADAAAAMWEMSTHPELVEISSTLTHDVTITGANARTMTIANGFNPVTPIAFPEVICIKNGFAYHLGEESGRCSVALWETPSGARRVSVVMGGETSLRRYQDLRSMMDAEILRSSGFG